MCSAIRWFWHRLAVLSLKKTNLQLNVEKIYCEEENIYWQQTLSNTTLAIQLCEIQI